MFTIRQINSKSLLTSFRVNFKDTLLAMGRRIHQFFVVSDRSKLAYDHSSDDRKFLNIANNEVINPAFNIFENYDGTADYQMPLEYV